MKDINRSPREPPTAHGASFLAHPSDALVQRLARSRLYYGWYIVAVVFVMGIPTVGFNGPFFGIFLKPMSKEFGWTRAMTTGAVTLGTLVAAGAGVVLGWVLDRYGPRWMAVGGCILLGASYVGLSQVNSLLFFYLAYALGRSVMQSALGRSMMNTLVSKWFVRRRAMAIAVSIMGSYLGGVALAPLAQGIIDSQGWRQAWAFFGLLTWALVLIPWLFLRRVPEDLGLLPDGAASEKPLATTTLTSTPRPLAPSPSTRPAEGESNLTLPEAMRSVSFWLLCFMVGINVMSTTGVTFHMVPHFTDVGIATPVAAASVSVFTMVQVPTIFLWSLLSNRIGPRQALLGVLLSLAAGVFFIARADTAVEAFLGAGLFGVGFAGYLLVVDLLWADFFGRRYLGSIRGVSLVFQLVGNASGSLIAALLYDAGGDYSDSFRAIILALLGSSILLLLTRKPKPKAPLPEPQRGAA